MEYDDSKPDPNASRNTKNVIYGEPEFQVRFRDRNGNILGEIETVQTEAQNIPILHLYGSNKQMGQAHGFLMYHKIKKFYNDLIIYALKCYSKM